MRCYVGWVLAGLVWAGTATATPADACRALITGNYNDLPDAPTTLTAVDVMPATDGLPEHCRVSGYVAPQNRFELRLPLTSWNEKFLMQGCGGLCGQIPSAACDDVLARDYAVVTTDMGHSGQPFQALWAYNNRQAEIDFAYRATHVVTIAAKALIEAFYARAPDYAYFRGCSTGGRQGLVEAQRFPGDFDGIISGAPVLDETATAALHLIWSGRANLDDNGEAILEADDVRVAHEAIIAACDMTDGVEDRLLEDPRRCDWRNALRARFSDAQIAVFDRLYRGARTGEGRLLRPGGLMPGSEYEWVPYFVGQDGGPAVFHPDGAISQLYQYLLFLDDPGPGHSAAEFDFDRDPQRLALMEVIYSATDPDLRRFRDRGGKLIVYQGWDDVEVTPLNTIDYFETMQATMGGAQTTAEFARLFMMPGVAHCRRGPGADLVDWLTVLERWVEEGEAPDRVVAYHPTEPQSYLGLPRRRFPLEGDAIDWDRSLFPYPANERHDGERRPVDTGN